ncbi:MAG: hypothetical protein KDA42_04285 [Planctomycetales bacterium]|nr:hypothetical protein [Planctomycetales bacterium]
MAHIAVVGDHAHVAAQTAAMAATERTFANSIALVDLLSRIATVAITRFLEFVRKVR